MCIRDSHDVGHGPFGHFFDEHYLSAWGLTHEDIGRRIIVKKLGATIAQIARGPSGSFARGETLDPRQVAYLIKMPEAGGGEKQPRWLQWLRQLFSGIYTVDNLDYVQRDAYMTGFSLDMVDVPRLRYYTFFTKDGLTLHQSGISALRRFLNARLNLYSNVYFHRTTRALDLHLQEIFSETLRLLYPQSPLKNLDAYLGCDEWSLFSEVQGWLSVKDPRRRKLAREWQKIHARKLKWKMSFATEISVDSIQRGTEFVGAQNYEARIRECLPAGMKRLAFRVDVATQDPRPLNPIAEPGKQINIFNPVTGKTSPEPLNEIYRFIPARVRHFRVFALNHDHDEELSRAAEAALGNVERSIPTNV
jgi:HD superfamily phosphohydrolase